MKIGMAGPITLSRLEGRLDHPPGLPRGYEFPLIADMVVELLDRGHHVSVFTLDASITVPLTFEAGNLTVHIGRMRATHRARDLFSAERAELEAAMRSDKCDVIHAHWTYEFALAAQASRQPYVVTAHDAPLDNARLFRLPYWWIKAVVARRLITPEVSISAVSPYVKQHFERYFRAHEVRVIPNAVPAELQAGTPAALDQINYQPTFATVLGGWDRQKNGVTAINAFAIARRTLPNARLVMFGRGYGPGEEAERYVKQHYESLPIEFAGHIDSLELRARLRSEVTILVHPSRMESFGMVLIEAMALGVAVIAGARSGAVPWTLNEGACGVLVDIESPAAVAAAMVALAQDQPRRRALRVVASEYVSRHFAMPTVMSAYEEWYRSSVEDWPHCLKASAK